MYENKSASHAIVRKSNAHDTAENVAAAVAVHGGYLATRPIKITGFYFYVTVALVADTLAPAVAIKQRPTYNSSSGEVTIATLTLPDLTAAGKVVYKRVEPYLINAGDEISLEHTVQCTSAGTAAGQGFYGFDYEIISEAAGNQTDWVASA